MTAKFGRHSRLWEPPKHQPPEKITYVSAQTAYSELTQRAFCLWVLMHTEKDPYYGLGKLAKEVGKAGIQAVDRWVDELRLKDYMIADHPHKNKMVRMRIVKRMKIPRGSLFTILDSTLLRDLKNTKKAV